MAVSPCEKILACGDANCTIRLYDMTSGKVNFPTCIKYTCTICVVTCGGSCEKLNSTCTHMSWLLILTCSVII